MTVIRAIVQQGSNDVLVNLENYLTLQEASSVASQAAQEAKQEILDDLASADSGEGAALVNFRQTGSTHDRSVAGKFRDAISILDYIPEDEHDAIRDRTTIYNASDAFAEAWDALVAQGGGSLLLPSGLYRVGRVSGWVIDSTANLGLTGDRGFSIIGQGTGATSIQIDEPNGFLKWVHPSRNIRLRLADFAVYGNVAGNVGNVFHLESVPGGTHHHRDLIADNLHLSAPGASSGDNNHWGTAFYCKALHRPLFNNVFITGPVLPSSSNKYAGTACIDVPDCYGPELLNGALWGCQYGFRYVGVGASSGEGGKVNKSVLDNQIGAYVESASLEPGFEVDGVHTNCTVAGIWIKNRKLVTLSNAIVYEDGGAVAAYSDIKLEGCEDVSISNYTFFFGLNTSRINVDINATCKRIYINDSKHHCDGTAYKLAAGADDITVKDAFYTSLVDTQISDLGATNLYVKHRRRKHARLSLAVAQSIPNGAGTTVTWDTSDVNIGGWLAGAPPVSVFTVPANQGIRRIRLTANMVWANNSTGVRHIFFRKNGATYAGRTAQHMNANGLTAGNVVSSIIDVQDGDTFEVQVLQGSGGALNFGGTNDAWFAIESVD